MKRLLTLVFTSCFCLLAAMAASVGDIMWAENFDGYSTDGVPNGSITDSHSGTTVYSGSVTYACSNGGSSTKVLSDKTLQIGRNNGTFTVSGISTGGASELTITFAKSGSGTLGITCSGATISGSSSGATISNPTGATFSLTFKNTKSNKDLTIDNISIAVSEMPEALPVIPDDPTGTYHTYTVDNSTIFPNPERGFIEQLEAHINTGAANRYCVKGNEWYFEQTGDNIPNERLVLVLYYLDHFKSSNLPTEIINAFDEDMQVLRDYGFKCILRYAYCQDDNVDATKAQMLAHINQLKNKWAANKDVIYCFQAGFIGQWGEWYYTSHFTNETSNMTSDRREIVDALLAALPSDVYIQLRTPFQKTQYLSDATPISSGNAFNGSTKSRLGHHNDAYLNGATNSGTYSSVSDTATQKPYVATETLYVPIGGETNIESSSDASTYATREKTIAESSRLHYTFLKGGDWPSEVMTPWHSDGTYDELNKKLGYRYQLLNGSYTNTANVGGTMHVHMNIKNVGFAPLYNERHAYIVLKNGSNTYSIAMTTDPRRWSPNGVITEIIEDLALPAGIVPGTYDIYLSLPDNHSGLASDPRYAVRFANTGIWDSTHGWNNLNATITVSAGSTPTLTVSPTSVNFGDKTINTTHTNTITVSGSNLSANATVSSNNAALTVSPATITPAQASSGQTVTLSLTPTATGSGSATVTIASSGATTKTVTVTWNGVTSAPSVVELPATVDKGNMSAVSAGMTYYNSTYFQLNPTCSSSVPSAPYAEWTVLLTHPGRYIVSEAGYYHYGHNYLIELRSGNTVISSYQTATTYVTGEQTITQGTKWDLSGVSAGTYTLRVRNNLSGGDPCLKSITLDYDGEILPVIPVVPADPSGTSRTYTADNTTIFPNPERGFLTMVEGHLSTSDKYAVNTSSHKSYIDSHVAADNLSLILVEYFLENYKTSNTIPTEVLNAFDEDMAVLRSKGLKAIVRFAYTDSDEGDIGHDAALSYIQKHLAQYKSHWEDNADVIFVFQMGLVGSWGEWYYTEHFGNKSSHMNAERIALVDTMMKATPQDRCVQIRTPLFKTEYLASKGLSTAPISYSEAYNGSIKSRLGHHNDAFLYNADNMGTYSDTSVQKPYISRETFYVPIGGESDITDSDQADEQASPEATIAEMSYLHWTFIQSGYSTVVTNKWRANGTFDELNRRLGYRYQLVNGTYTNSSTVGGKIKVYMNIRNVGFAPLYNKRHAYIILTNASNTYSIKMDTDPRRWRPNGVVTEIGEELDLPDGIVPGTYNLYLSLPDYYGSLASDPRYSIRFANTDIWDSTHGWNNLNATITVSAGSTPTLTVSPTSVNFGDKMINTTHTNTITVSGSNLSANATVSSNNAALTVSPATITPAQASSGQTVTLSLTPTATGSGSATVTIASSGATTKTVTVTWNGVAAPSVVDLPGTVNKGNKSATSDDKWFSDNTDYYNFGDDWGVDGSDGYNLSRWIEWNVRINTPGQFSVTEDTYCANGHTWELQLYNGVTPVGDPYITTDDHWGEGYQNYTQDAKWDLSGITPGEYTLRVKNHTEYGQPKLKSLTFAAAAATYTVTWDANGGSCGTATSNVTAGSAVGTLPVATKTGYTFTGWFTETSGGTQITTSTVPTGNVTYHAQYSINSYALTVNTNNATYGSVSGGGTYTYNTVHAITATPNTGYAFDHWELNSTNVSTSATYNVTIPANAVTYTAIFVPGTVNYTVKHYQQNTERNGYYIHQTETLSGTTGTTTAAAAKSYEGFTAQPFSQTTIAANGSTEVTIYYNRNSYTITYNKGTYGTGSQVTDTKYYGVNLTLRGATFTRGGYTQTGWASNAAGTDYAYDLSGTYSGNSAITLYPYWTAPEYVVFDNNNGTGDGNWSTASNWQGGVLPTISQTARIYKPCTVDVTTAVAKEVLIATGTGYTGHLTIAPTAGLRVAQKVRKAVNGNFDSPTTVGAADLTIQASSAGQGALVLGTEDGTAQATVQLYSKAYIDAHKHWQYMGIPFSNTPLAQSLFSGGYMYRWDETTAAGWNSVTNSTTLNPFAGYCLSQSAAKTYEMTGTLCASSNRNLTVSHTSAGQSGANLFSNSWTAPIEIASFEDGDFSTAAIDKTIYLFNTGSLAEYTAIGGEANTGSSPGQFFAIPIHAAPYAIGLPTVIPPMQGFQVMTTATGGLTLNYARLTAPYDGSHLATEPLKAPKSEETPDVLRLTVYGQSGQSSSDRFYLLKHSACTEGFDNGWDGKKILGSDVVSLYSLSPDGNMAVDSRGEMLGTDIVFCAGTDTHYTIEMYYTGSQTLYLFDRVEGVCVPIISGTNYSFEAASNAAPSIRFRIIANDATGIEQIQNDEVPSTKLLRDGHLYIRHAGKLYDARGRKVSE